MCQVALPADFNILSHYVDNLDVCLAHSRRIQFEANAAASRGNLQKLTVSR